MVEIHGDCGISVKVIADSINSDGNRITTVEKVFPRIILAEENTHKMESKNSASSRAIPTKKMIELIKSSPFIPEFIGKNQAGMQAKIQLEGQERADFLAEWEAAKNDAIRHLEAMDAIGAHKQLASRITEPWMMMKTVNTATERANYLWLRDHEDAQPEIAILADCLKKALNQSEPEFLHPGEWHVPYVETEIVYGIGFDSDMTERVYKSDGQVITFEQALKLSASCCAQVSYRTLNTGLEKAIQIYNRLLPENINSQEPAHYSPLEHQATPILYPENPFDPKEWQSGVTHVRKDGTLWSGNFRGWIQNRQMIMPMRGDDSLARNFSKHIRHNRR